MKRALRITVISLGVVIVGLIGWRVGQLEKRGVGGDAIPDYGKVSDFEFVDQSGESFGLNDLKGHVWVADFIFTRCMGPCPMLTTRMASLAKDFEDDGNIRFVSFSVDPDYDKPGVLAAYAKTYDADADRWRFLTGPKEKMYALIRTSFHLAVEPTPNPTPSITDILHSLYFVLVDKDGRVRGYFNSGEPDALDQLRERVRAL